MEQFAALTLIALRSREACLALTAEGAPLPVTAPPQATRGKLLAAAAVVINKRAAWRSAKDFSRGSKVIELMWQGGRRRKKEEEEEAACKMQCWEEKNVSNTHVFEFHCG